MPTAQIQRTSLPGALTAHAILIGIDRYPAIAKNLTTPVADTRAVREALVQHQGFAAENVHVCLDATKADIETFLTEIRTGGTILPEDALLFYYAGHGLAGDIDGAGAAGYLMPSDVSFSVAELSENPTLIPMEWLFAELADFDCHHTLAIMDCCFAGAFRRISRTRATLGLGLRSMTQERFARYQSKRAWQVLASAGPAEKAADLISERGEADTHSPFAKALVAALSGRARTDFKPPGKNLGDGILTAHELFLYLHDEVERRTRTATEFKPQNPDLFPMADHDGGQFIFCDPRHPHNDPRWDERKVINPYKGLAQYDIGDADYYFGRTTDVGNLLQIFQLVPGERQGDEQPPSLLVLSGPSGSGKSSLVKAGLLPAFREADYEIYQFRPGNRPWTLQGWRDGGWQTVLETSDQPFRFVEATAQRAPDQDFYFDPFARQLLYIDQFEELFTACSPEERELLNEYLKELFVETHGREFRVIISLRSDFEWQLELSEFGKLYWDREQAFYRYYRLYRLSTLGLEDLRSALVNPALLSAYEFGNDEEGDLTDLILEELNYLPSALPLLSYTMQEMVKLTDREERLFTRKIYLDELGGVSGALSRRMQLIYDKLGLSADVAPASAPEKSSSPTPAQELLRTIFLRMVSLSDGEYIRRRVYRLPEADELAFAGDDAAAENILAILRKADLLVTGGEGQTRYEELIHDSLINSWTTGKQWINDFGKENLTLQRQLWDAVRDNRLTTPAPTLGYGTQPEDGNPFGAPLTEKFSRLWDANPKLVQVIQQVAADSAFLLEKDAEVFLEEVLEGVGPEDRERFYEFWQDCHAKKEFPDLNSLILSGQSDKLLRALLAHGKHWLNRAEIDFIQQSWEARIADILNLRRERDEARAARERTSLEMIEASWKAGAYLERSRSGDQEPPLEFTVPGVRTMYKKLQLIMSLDKVISLAPVPVFLRGPHGTDFDLLSDDFGHYNPAFLEWAKSRVIPASRNPLLRQATQPFYRAYMRDMARTYHLALLHLRQYPVLRKARVAHYANGGTVSTGRHLSQFAQGEYTFPEWSTMGRAVGGDVTHYFVTAIEFWARREIDGTATAFADILDELLATYDQEWLATEPDGDTIYG